LTALKYDENEIADALLKQLFKDIMGSAFQPDASSWVEIGFQREDTPGSDLRSTGLLCPLQILWIMNENETGSTLIKDLHALSISTDHAFPLMATCVNIASISITSLKRGLFNKTLLKELPSQKSEQTESTSLKGEPSSPKKSAPETSTGGNDSAVFAELKVLSILSRYVATFLTHFKDEWKDSKSISELGRVLEKVEKNVRANPLQF
jgi:hypothetical protein